MPILSNLLLNEETGELDLAAIEECAKARAAREFGSPNFPPKYLREARAWSTERAQMLRANWLQFRGLSPDQAPVMTTVPTWGSSGDSFGG